MDYADVQKRFGLALKGWRRKSNLSQEELAWRAGLHRSYVADIERGARNASLQSIEKLSRALQISFSTFFEPFGDFPGPGYIERKNRPVEILLVGGDPAESDAILQAFRRANVQNQIHVARDATSALEYLWGPARPAEAPLQRSPRLVLLDLHTAKTGSMEVLRRLKQDERGRNIPVIVLTDSPARPEVLESKRLGAEVALAKPVDIQRFATVLPKVSCCWKLFHHQEQEESSNQ
jgi:CheY-like chemotaxis protein/DNA-binding XRE family transcriptional regulator